MPDKAGRMTHQEKTFIDRYSRTGDADYAAQAAEYAQPGRDAGRALSRPAVQDAIRREQIARLNNELLPLAIATLIDVMTSPKATERGKLTATALVLKHTVGAAVDPTEGKEPHEMSAHELQQRIEALRREAADRAKPVTIEAEPGAPDSGVFD